MKMIIAKTQEGREFFYSTKDSYTVSKNSYRQICDIMNACKWQLQAGEKWHVYQVDDYEIENMSAFYQKVSIRKGIVTARYM